jgi:hypothetical protein
MLISTEKIGGAPQIFSKPSTALIYRLRSIHGSIQVNKRHIHLATQYSYSKVTVRRCGSTEGAFTVVPTLWIYMIHGKPPS